ncbi:MAG: hypothetical protein ABGX16_11470 [Pirellulales bacterium]
MISSSCGGHRISLKRHDWKCLGTAVLLFSLGCSDSQQVAPVSGTITFEGQPLVGASITTQPIATDSIEVGSGSFGLTDEQGRYELELVKPAQKGAIIAEHRVMISHVAGNQTKDKAQTSEDGETKSWDDATVVKSGVARAWPLRYIDGSLRLTVPPEGNTDADFDLRK